MCNFFWLGAVQIEIDLPQVIKHIVKGERARIQRDEFAYEDNIDAAHVVEEEIEISH